MLRAGHIGQTRLPPCQRIKWLFGAIGFQTAVILCAVAALARLGR